MDWCGLFPYSREEGTYAADLPDQVSAELISERHVELSELQDAITATRRDQLIGSTIEVLVDEPGIGRSHREAPEIDGVVKVPQTLEPRGIYNVHVTGSDGLDLEAELGGIRQ